jgi:hypothetical protein
MLTSAATAESSNIARMEGSRQEWVSISRSLTSPLPRTACNKQQDQKGRTSSITSQANRLPNFWEKDLIWLVKRAKQKYLNWASCVNPAYRNSCSIISIFVIPCIPSPHLFPNRIGGEGPKSLQTFFFNVFTESGKEEGRGELRKDWESEHISPKRQLRNITQRAVWIQ